jgi:hypothetical protein
MLVIVVFGVEAQRRELDLGSWSRLDDGLARCVELG